MIDLFKEIIADFHQRELPGPITSRNLSVPLNSRKIITIVGPRRTGKTWFLYSIIKELRKTVDPRKLIYINFEDERLELTARDFQSIIDAYQQLYPSTPLSELYFFFDEMQEIEGWEKFTRRLHDTISDKIFITGSSARLMSSEIATTLRGRSLSYHLLPFSFSEYLRFHGVSTSRIHSSSDRNNIMSYFDTFLIRGGYPEVFTYDETLFIKTMQSYIDIMLYRDIIERYNITNVHVVKDMMKRLITCNANIFSVHKYYNDSKSRGFHISKDSLYRLLDHFEDAYAVIPVSKYYDSLIKQEKSMKKVYVNDTGIMAAYNFKKEMDTGWLFETLVFLEILKKDQSVFYYSNGFETDFIIHNNNDINRVIQACYTINDENRNREISGLQKALERFEIKEGLIITKNQEEELHLDGRKIIIYPAWKWSLQL